MIEGGYALGVAKIDFKNDAYEDSDQGLNTFEMIYERGITKDIAVGLELNQTDQDGIKGLGDYEFYIKGEFSNIFYEARYNYLDFKSKSYKQNNKKIYLYDNIEGTDLYNVIIRSTKVIAFHGMMTNLASLEKIPVLDLFYCKINNWNDYKNYRNSFYEFKPNYKYYDFTIPKKSMKETLNKMKFSLKK